MEFRSGMDPVRFLFPGCRKVIGQLPLVGLEKHDMVVFIFRKSGEIFIFKEYGQTEGIIRKTLLSPRGEIRPSVC